MIKELVSIDSVFIDIGANIGLYTKFIAPLVYQVISIEPVPSTSYLLKRNIKRFKFKNVGVLQIAISDKIGKTEIKIPNQAGVKNYYRASIEEMSPSLIEETFTVLTQTIDSLFLSQVDNISFIKCDVEGHELSCLKGAKQFIPQSKAGWLIEINGDLDDKKSSAYEVNQLMQRNGYSTFILNNGKLEKRIRGKMSINYFYLKQQHLDILNQTDFLKHTP